MANTIIMSKYQGLGNDYLILDPKKNQVQLQGKKIALLCQRGFGLGADGACDHRGCGVGVLVGALASL